MSRQGSGHGLPLGDREHGQRRALGVLQDQAGGAGGNRPRGYIQGHRQRPGRAVGQRAALGHRGHLGCVHEAAQRRERPRGEQLEVAELGLAERAGGPVGKLRGQGRRCRWRSVLGQLCLRNVTLTRYASVLQVRENHDGPRNCRRVRSGKGGPRQDVTLLARSGPRASYHVQHLIVRTRAGAAKRVNLKCSTDSRVCLDPAGSCCPRPVPSEARGSQVDGRTAITRTS